MARILVEMSDELLAEIDKARGLVPRNAWIRDVIGRSFGPTPDTPETVAEKMKTVRAVKKAAEGAEIVTTVPNYGRVLNQHRFMGMGKRCNKCGGTREDHPE